MKLKDTVQFFEQYLALYFKYFVAVVSLKPERLLAPKLEERILGKSEILIPNADATTHGFNPNLIGFLVISIALASAIFGVVFDGLKPANLLSAVLVTIFFWLLAGSSIWGLVRLSRTRREYLEIVSQSMAIFAVVYVLSSVVTVVLASIVTVFGPYISKPLGSLIEKPIYIYFFIQGILLLFYLSTSLSRLHFVSLYKTLPIVITVVLVWVPLNFILFLGAGEKRLPMLAPPEPLPVSTIHRDLIRELNEIAHRHDSTPLTDQEIRAQLVKEYSRRYYMYRALFLLTGRRDLLDTYPKHNFYFERIQALRGLQDCQEMNNLKDRYDSIRKIYETSDFDIVGSPGFSESYNALRKVELKLLPCSHALDRENSYNQYK